MSTKEKKGILILSDMEGVAGIADKRLVSPDNVFWEHYGRALLTEEINVVASTLYHRGIKRIYLSESHNYGKNTVYKKLFPFITVLPPHSAQSNMHGRELWDKIYSNSSISAVILVGFHGMEGSEGFLPHSLDSNIFRSIEVNGKPTGEIGLFSAIAGSYDIPIIGITGDEAAVKEAKKHMPHISCIVTKKLQDGWLSLVPIETVYERINQTISQAVERASDKSPFKFSSPVTICASLKHKKFLGSLSIKGDFKIDKDNLKITISHQNYLDAYDIFWDIYLNIITC